PAASSSAAAQAPSADNAVRARLADVAGDDEEFMIELVNAFLSGGEDTVQELRAAVELGDAAAIGRAAHKLKGAAANLHVNNLATLSFELETRAKAGQQSDWRADLERIAAEFARVCTGLRTEFGLEEPARKTG
ncbi:MAG TPA: Hpt domain-containing protein, partial [Steroidobacteraceae bacterium]|nr:Hpt domain-containing protein [Steroidobacteraceae bacterium]